MDVAFSIVYSKGEEVWRRGGKRSGRTGRLADDGKRSAALGVLLTCVYPIGGGVRGGGGSQVEPRRRAGGFLWHFKMVQNHLLRPVKPGSLLRPVKLHKNGCMCFSTGLNKEPVLTGLTRNQA